jgi:hypothetical protein
MLELRLKYESLTLFQAMRMARAKALCKGEGLKRKGGGGCCNPCGGQRDLWKRNMSAETQRKRRIGSHML